MLKNKKNIIKTVLSLFIAVILIQGLFFKFTGSPETDHIFNTLDAWAAGLGFGGLFVPPGIFNAYVVGSAELVASLLLLAGLFMKRPLFTALGSVMALGVISGAVFFHLFTPLGIVVMDDGGSLFAMAVGVWASSLALIIMHKSTLLGLISKA